MPDEKKTETTETTTTEENVLVKAETVKDLGGLKAGQTLEVTDATLKAMRNRRILDIATTAAIGTVTTVAAGVGGYKYGVSQGLAQAEADLAGADNVEPLMAAHG